MTTDQNALDRECIGAYVLAIESLPERIKDARRLVQQLESLDLLDEVTLVPAVYWADRESFLQEIRAFPQHTFTATYLQKHLLGQVACTFSHLRVWRRLLASPYQGAFVFEDDMYLEDEQGFADLLQQLRHEPRLEWLRVHVMKQFREAIPPHSDVGWLAPDQAPWGFAAYYLTRTAAQKLLDHASGINRPVDWFPPQLRELGLLDCQVVTRSLAEHHPFEGNPEDLADRHYREQRLNKQQKAASTIWKSPEIASDNEVYDMLTRQRQLHELATEGFTILPGIIDADEIAASRQRVLQNLPLFKNTRPSASARHLAGFHRFPGLEQLHTRLASHPEVLSLVRAAVGGEVQSIGLTDITVNRSQPWHKDLLRGRFSHYLPDGSLSWDTDGAGVFKVLQYLQPGASLKIIRGSHLQAVSLDSDRYSEPNDLEKVAHIEIQAGDVVVMDIRCSHRGADESAYIDGQWDDDPRMLVSTALGGIDHPLTRAMEIGNFHRLLDWIERNP